MANDAERQDIARKFLLSLWGMATLILLFSVIFLAYEMATGDSVAIPFASERFASTTGADAGLAKSKRVRLYFANPQQLSLVPEYRDIGIGDHTVENCRLVLQELIVGPREALGPVLSPSTRIRGMYLLENGELIVDFSRDLEAGLVASATSELLMIQGVTSSLTQVEIKGEDGPPVKRIRFLFEGSPPQNTFPVHLELEEAIAPDRNLTRIYREGAPNV